MQVALDDTIAGCVAAVRTLLLYSGSPGFGSVDSISFEAEQSLKLIQVH